MLARKFMESLSILVVVTVVIAGCGGGGGGGGVEVEPKTAWEMFEAGDFHGAMARFRDDARTDSTNVDIWTGIAWCQLSVDDLGAARAAFEELVDVDPRPIDAVAGLAYTLGALREYRRAVDRIDEVIAAQPDYRFAHSRRVDEDGLHLLGARCLFLSDRFEESYDYLRHVEGAIALDPRADDFEQRLVAEIARLERAR